MTSSKEATTLQLGPRVYLRSPSAADGLALLALNQASADFHRGWVYPPITPADFAAYVMRCQLDNYVGMLICRRSDDALLGAINLSEIVRGPLQSAYLGYYIGAPFARQGYMREALNLALRHAFETLKLHRVEANIQPNNHPSIALVQRAGFTQEGYSRRYLKIGGRWRDHQRWALLAEDWRRLRRTPPAPDFQILPITPDDAAWVRQLTIEEWAAPQVVAHGVIYEPERLPGFIALQGDTRVGLATYHITEADCELVTLNSRQPGLGIGTALIAAVQAAATQAGCQRVWLITTNDNTAALRFYQRRGFTLVAVHRNAIERSRMIKPSIPLIGDDGIPIRDEIELEWRVAG